MQKLLHLVINTNTNHFNTGRIGGKAHVSGSNSVCITPAGDTIEGVPLVFYFGTNRSPKFKTLEEVLVHAVHFQ